MVGCWCGYLSICLEQGADLHMAQLMPLPLTVSCFSKIQIGFTFLVPAHPGSPGKMAIKRECVCVCSDFHQKQAAKKALMKKALDKNPDEFYFKMIRTRMEVDLLFCLLFRNLTFGVY